MAGPTVARKVESDEELKKERGKKNNINKISDRKGKTAEKGSNRTGNVADGTESS